MTTHPSRGAEHPDYPTLIGHDIPIWTTVQTDGSFIVVHGLSIFDPWLAGIAQPHRDDLPGWVHRTLVRGADIGQERLVMQAAESAVLGSQRLRQALAVVSKSNVANRRLERHVVRLREDLATRLDQFEMQAGALRMVSN